MSDSAGRKAHSAGGQTFRVGSVKSEGGWQCLAQGRHVTAFGSLADPLQAHLIHFVWSISA